MRARTLEERLSEEAEPGAAEPAPAGILALQQSAGNAAVSRALLQRDNPGPGGATTTHPELERPSNGPDVELLQLKLNWHLGFMRRTLLDVDSDFGRKTERAVIAVKRARGISPADGKAGAETWTALEAQPAAGPASAQQGAGPEYDRMLEDGLLDVTLAIGFDEHGITPHEAHEIRRGLGEVRGFTEDLAAAMALRRAAGRPETPGGSHFSKQSYGTSAGRPVHAALRLIEPVTESATGDSGAASRDAAVAGMNESDLFAYGGHARYGTGPDFDRNYHFVVHWDTFPRPPAGRTGDETIGTMDEFVAATRVTTAGRFEELESAGAVEFFAHPGGNVVINVAAQSHTRELGAYFMGRANAGQTNPLDTQTTESRYRLWMFNGCTTRDYVRTVRRNPRLGSRDLDMVVTDPATYLTSYGEGILSFLDGVMAQESARALDERMEDATPFETGTHSASGFEDNPSR